MKKILFTIFLFCLVSSSITVGQDFTIKSAYQLGKYGEYYGASFSNWIRTWNNEKVVLQSTYGFVLGNHWGEKSTIKNFKRFEFGFESRNTMVTGKDFFNIINVSYLLTYYDNEVNGSTKNIYKNGWMFSFGFGTKIFSPMAITARYVWGPESGIRLGMEYDLRNVF